jgi:hypothetical protein
LTYYWLSFADGARPPGSQFLGVAIVPAEDFVRAVGITHLGGYNPGGEVAGYPYVNDPTGDLGIEVPAEYVGRLLTKAEAEALDAKMHELYPAQARPVVVEPEVVYGACAGAAKEPTG